MKNLLSWSTQHNESGLGQINQPEMSLLEDYMEILAWDVFASRTSEYYFDEEIGINGLFF